MLSYLVSLCSHCNRGSVSGGVAEHCRGAVVAAFLQRSQGSSPGNPSTCGSKGSPLALQETTTASRSEWDGPGVEETAGKHLGSQKGSPSSVGRAAVFEEHARAGSRLECCQL